MDPIVDAHLDLAWNAVRRGRDLRRPLAEIRAEEARDEQTAMVTLGEAARGGVALMCGSIFTGGARIDGAGEIEYDPAHGEAGRAQLEVYLGWEREGAVRIVRDRASLAAHVAAWEADRLPGLLIAMEGAEPVAEPAELDWWFGQGVRMIGPAWGPTRYCGGFAGTGGRATGFTPAGRELAERMAALGLVLDTAHMSMESWAEAVAFEDVRVVCTHTSPRDVLGRERLPGAAELRAIADRGGVVGLGLGNLFVSNGWWSDSTERPPLGLADAARVFAVMAGAAGWEHVGIGSDLDGGIGVEESPAELDSIADVRLLAGHLPAHAAAGVLGGNWLRFFAEALPDAPR